MTDYKLAGQLLAEQERKSRPIPAWLSVAEAQRGADAERELNIPAGAGARLPEVDNILEQQRLRRRLEMAPKLRAFMDDAINASLAKDDTENLTLIEKAGNHVAKGGLNVAAGAMAAEGARSWDLSRYAGKTRDEIKDMLLPPDERARLMAEGMFGQATISARLANVDRIVEIVGKSTPEQLMRRSASAYEAAGDVLKTSRKLKGFEWGEEFARKYAEPAIKQPTASKQALELLKGFAADPVGGWVFMQGVVLESAPALGAAAVTGAVTRSPGAAIAAMGLGSGSMEYSGQVQEFLQSKGIDITTDEGRLALMSSPQIMREAHQKGFAKGMVVGMMDAMSGGVAGKMLMSSPAGNILAQMFVQAAMGAGGEVLGDIAAGNDPNAANAILEAMAEIVGTVGEVAVFGGRKAFTRDERRAAKAGEARAVLEPLGEAATKSKLKERARDRFMAFLEKTDWQDVDIYVDASTLNTFFQAKDSVPGDYGLDVETFNEAVLSGNDVAIPATLYADKIAGTEDAEFFLANGRFSSEAMSEAEAARFNELIREETEKEGERIEAELRADLEARASDIQVRDAMYSQFREAGRAPDAAEREASLWQAFFRTQAERYGEDPLELARMFGVRVEGPTNARSRIRDNFDIAINTLRARRTKPVKPKQEAMRQNRAARDEWKASEKRQGEIALDAQGKIDALIAAGHDLSSSPEINAELDRIKEAREATDQLRQAWRDVVDANEAVIYGTEGDPNVAAAPEEGAVITPEDDLAPIMEELDRLGLTLDMTNDEIAEAMGIGEFAGEGTLFQQAPPVGSEAFKRWFGDSKVVDENGDPLVMYHGTQADFQFFEYGKIGSRFPVSRGFYFTSRPSRASAYATGIAGHLDPSRTLPGANMVPVYLSLQNPLIVDLPAEMVTGEDLVDAKGGAFVEEAKDAGHDGVIIKRQRGDGYEEDFAIAFHPEQIKSVFNRGTFDPSDPRIMFQQQTPEQFLASDGEWRNQDVTVQDEDGNNVDVPAGLAADVLMERLEQARQILRCVNAG